jgi:site-specific DNA recombinase
MKKKTNVERPNTCVIYVRVSSEEQVKNYSLQNQERSCKEYAERNGWKVIKVFREEGESAKTANRTQLKLMQKFCAENKGKIGYLIVWKVDRFARYQIDHFALKAIFRQSGVELKSATEVLEDSPIGQAAEGMLAVMAQFENATKIERTRDGIKARAEDGYWISGAPWGYKNILDEVMDKKIIVPVSERVPIVRFIFEEFARATIGFRELTKKVNKRWNARSRHGNKISTQLVYKILRNPIYCGRIVVPKLKVDIKGRHESIISEQLYREVQYIMDGGRKSKQPKNIDNKDFPLRGMRCAACGRHISGGNSTGRNKKYAYYGCINPICPNPERRSVGKEDFERDFTQFLLHITPDPPTLEGLGEAIKIVYKKESGESILAAKKIERGLEQLEKDMDELLNLRIKGTIDDETYTRQNEKMKATRVELVSERAGMMTTDTSIEAAVEFGIRVVQEFPNSWQELEPGELRVLRGLFFPQNLEYHYPGFKTAELAPIYNLKSPETDEKTLMVTLRGFEPRFVP